jgi:two-component system sensor histidine kinase FlrB
MQTTQYDQVEDGRAELRAAFVAFGSVSEQLSGTFDCLSGEVAKLRLELAEARAGNENLAARLSALLQALPAGVLVLDSQGLVRECNAAALELFGEPLLGQGFAALLGRAALKPGRPLEPTELRSGRFVNISRRALASPVVGDGLDGSLVGGEVVLVADVTESQLMQALLGRQQRLLTLGELAAGLAHQIRTPLAAALLYATQMSLPGRTAADLERCAGKTVTSLVQLDRLVTDMLAFTHGGAAREVISVSALLEQVAQWLRPALRGGVTLTIRTDAPTLAVRANASSLVSAVLNLATNALQAAAGDLKLELSARRAGTDRAQIIVSDNGPGVPEDLRGRIFEPFFTTKAHGNGIGLAIVKSVVEAHHGTVRLSAAERGATFIIDLPAEENT